MSVVKTNRRQHGEIPLDNNPEVGFLTRLETHGVGAQNVFFMLSHTGAPDGKMRAIPIPPEQAIDAGKGQGSELILVPQENPTQLVVVATSETYHYNGTYERIPEGWKKISFFLSLPPGVALYDWDYADLKPVHPDLPIDPETEESQRPADQKAAEITGDEKPFLKEPDSA